MLTEALPLYLLALAKQQKRGKIEERARHKIKKTHAQVYDWTPKKPHTPNHQPTHNGWKQIKTNPGPPQKTELAVVNQEE